MTQVSAIVAGATGLVGRSLLQRLAEAPEVERVTALVRRALPPAAASSPRVEARLVDFARPESWEPALAAEHAYVFCCLGTTIKQAGSQEAFRRVDYELPLELARRARAHGALGFFVITALGADPGSRVFYNRVKGELEEALRALDYPTLAIFRPSLLLGERDAPRFGERVAALLSGPVTPLLQGSLRKYRPIQADVVARAMVSAARTAAASRDPLGVAVYESDAIATLGR